MQFLSKLSHLPEPERHRSETRISNTLNNAATESQRGRLRAKSISVTKRPRYDQSGPQHDTDEPERKRRKNAKRELVFATRAEALNHRCSQRTPRRFDVVGWRQHRLESERLLQAFYLSISVSYLSFPRHSYTYLVPLHRIYHIAFFYSGKESDWEMSIASLKAEIDKEIPQNDICSIDDLRKLLHCLSFKFGNIHSDHYYKIGNREDVLYHRAQFAPVYTSILESKKVWTIFGDASFLHQNAHRHRAWFAQDVEHADLAPFGTGTGQRLNVWEFVTEDGLLCFPDGRPHISSFLYAYLMLGASAGTIYDPNTTQNADDIVRAFEKGIRAVKLDARYHRNDLVVIVIDGAKVNKTMPIDAINPKKVLLINNMTYFCAEFTLDDPE